MHMLINSHLQYIHTPTHTRMHTPTHKNIWDVLLGLPRILENLEKLLTSFSTFFFFRLNHTHKKLKNVLEKVVFSYLFFAWGIE